MNHPSKSMPYGLLSLILLCCAPPGAVHADEPPRPATAAPSEKRTDEPNGEQQFARALAKARFALSAHVRQVERGPEGRSIYGGPTYHDLHLQKVQIHRGTAALMRKARTANCDPKAGTCTFSILRQIFRVPTLPEHRDHTKSSALDPRFLPKGKRIVAFWIPGNPHWTVFGWTEKRARALQR